MRKPRSPYLRLYEKVISETELECVSIGMITCLERSCGLLCET